MSKNKEKYNKRQEVKHKADREQSKTLATVLNKPFQNYAEVVIKEIDNLLFRNRIFGANNVPNLNSLKKDFDSNVHPLDSAKAFFDSWY